MATEVLDLGLPLAAGSPLPWPWIKDIILARRTGGDAQLLVSELVANAVRHGGPPGVAVSVAVRASPETVRVEVTDRGTGFDPARLPAASGERGGGWGLPIVAALAHRWGVERDTNTTVWFEIDRPRRDTPIDPHPLPSQ